MQLNLSNIEYAYPAAAEPALNGVTATFPQGWTGIVGDNGGGKTTLCLVACCLLQPDAGTVTPPLVSLYCAQDASEPPANLEDFAFAYDSAAVSEEAAEMAPIPVSDDFAAPASETTKSEQEMIHEAIARSEEPETVADIVDVTGQGRGRNIAALLVGTPGELPSGVTPDHRFLLRFDIDGVSSQVLISVYGEKVFYISLSGEESDMMLSDYGWSSLRAKIYN